MAAKIHEGALNTRLLKHGAAVFRKLRGFKKAIWARRIGIGGREADFLLLNTSPPRLAVVESTVGMNGDWEQLRHYSRSLAKAKPQDVLEWIKASVVPGKPTKPGVKTRASANRDAPLREWLKPAKKPALAKLLRQAMARPLSVILLVHASPRSGKMALAVEVPLWEKMNPSPKRTRWSVGVVVSK